MSNAIFYLKQNDTKPSLSANLTQDGSVVDLTGASVKFHMGSIVDADAVIASAVTGSVRYDWDAADTEEAGRYPAEFQVTFSDEGIETFPNKDTLTIVIKPELA